MDIAIVAAARFPIAEPFAGGLEAHTHLLAERLSGRGHQVTVYAADGRGRFDVHRMLPVSFLASPTARRDISAGPSSALAEHHSYLDAILELQRRRPDIVHINAVHHLPFACARTAGARRSSRPPCTRRRRRGWSRRCCSPALATPRRRTVSVSHANARSWPDVAFDRVIHNGVDLDRWTRRPGRRRGGVVGPRRAGEGAAPGDRRRPPGRRAADPDGSGPRHGLLRAPRSGRASAATIRYVGHLDVADVAAVVGRAAVAVVTPEWDEPFGLIVAEALACGTPVAAFDRGAIRELLDDRTGRLAPAGDVGGAGRGDRRRVPARPGGLPPAGRDVLLRRRHGRRLRVVVRRAAGRGGCGVIVAPPPGAAPVRRPRRAGPAGLVRRRSGTSTGSSATASTSCTSTSGSRTAPPRISPRGPTPCGRAGIGLVFTVHDLDNPHLRSQHDHRRSLGLLVDRAGAVATLTRGRGGARSSRASGGRPPCCRIRTSSRWTRWPVVAAIARRRRGVYVHAATGRPNLDLEAIARAAARRVRPARRRARPARGTAPPSSSRSVASPRPAPWPSTCGPGLSDAELWDRLAAAELLLLPYRWGTHSGLLEAAHDLGTPVLAPSFGGYGDQGAHTYDDDPGRRGSPTPPACRAGGRRRPAPRRRPRPSASAYDRLYRERGRSA